MPRAKTATRTPKVSDGYRWIDKDPVIDHVISLMKQDGRSLTAIANAAYLSPTTLHAWDSGATRRPNNISIDFVLRAMGFERQIVQSERPKGAMRWRPASGK